MEQEIEKIADIIDEWRKGMQNYHTLAAWIYNAGYRLHPEQTNKLRKAVAHNVCGHAECYGTCPNYKGKDFSCQSKIPDQILSLFPDEEGGARIMSDENKCVICELKLENPIMLGETAPKAWAKKNGYDGFQWRERKESVMAALKNVREELLESDPHPDMFPDSVKFFTCMKHTGREFDTAGEEAEPSEDKEDA